jgi:hypothetical protein
MNKAVSNHRLFSWGGGFVAKRQHIDIQWIVSGIVSANLSSNKALSPLFFPRPALKTLDNPVEIVYIRTS